MLASERPMKRSAESERRGEVPHVVTWDRETRRGRMGLIGWFKKFSPSQPVLLQYSLNLRKIASVQSDPTQLGMACPLFRLTEGGAGFRAPGFDLSGLY